LLDSLRPPFLYPAIPAAAGTVAGELSWLEQRNHNPEVGGSSPSPATSFQLRH
jgi:hypothetical protein